MSDDAKLLEKENVDDLIARTRKFSETRKRKDSAILAFHQRLDSELRARASALTVRPIACLDRELSASGQQMASAWYMPLGEEKLDLAALVREGEIIAWQDGMTLFLPLGDPDETLVVSSFVHEFVHAVRGADVQPLEHHVHEEVCARLADHAFTDGSFHGRRGRICSAIWSSLQLPIYARLPGIPKTANVLARSYGSILDAPASVFDAFVSNSSSTSEMSNSSSTFEMFNSPVAHSRKRKRAPENPLPSSELALRRSTRKRARMTEKQFAGSVQTICKKN